MDPISIAVELELATLILAGVGAAATWLHHKRAQHQARVCERHHQEIKAQHERHHNEKMQVIAGMPSELLEDIGGDDAR